MEMTDEKSNLCKKEDSGNGGNRKNMKATGIVRRIDDLGRIVIPKEIRRTLRIRESDPLLTTLTHSGNADKQGGCEVFRALAEERIGRVKKELFVGGMIGLAERVRKG